MVFKVYDQDRDSAGIKPQLSATGLYPYLNPTANDNSFVTA